MNINDVWDGIFNVYNSVVPAFIITITMIIALVYIKGGTLTINIWGSLDKFSKSKKLASLEKIITALNLGTLIPLLLLAFFFIALITIGDISSWIATEVIPFPYNTGYAPSDLFSEIHSPTNISIIAKDFVNSNLQSRLNTLNGYPTLEEIVTHYSNERERLNNKYPERFREIQSYSTNIHKYQTIYGGFVAIIFFILFRLSTKIILSKFNKSALTNWKRITIALLTVLILTAAIRLQWEWRTEYRLIKEIGITADLLAEENPSNKISPNDELIVWVTDQQKAHQIRYFWLARNYEKITAILFHTSNRNLHYQ